MEYTAAAALLDGSFMTHAEHLRLASSFAMEDRWDESLWAHIDCIKNILRDGSPTAPLPLAPGSPDNIPREILGAAWWCFNSCFRRRGLRFIPESCPEAYELLTAFRPGASSELHASLKRTARGKILLQGIQIITGFTFARFAIQSGDKDAAVKWCRDTIDFAATHPPFATPDPNAVGLEKVVQLNMGYLREMLDALTKATNPSANMSDGDSPQRSAVIDPLSLEDFRNGIAPTPSDLDPAMLVCGKCGKRDIKLMRCSLCHKVAYCNRGCQKRDWRRHKNTTCGKRTG